MLELDQAQITIFQINLTSHIKHPNTQVPISSTPRAGGGGGGSYVADGPSQGHHDGRKTAGDQSTGFMWEGNFEKVMR